MNTTPRSRLFGPSRPFDPFGRGLLMLLSALLLPLPVPSLAAPGDLDPSFDGDGRVLTDFGAFERVEALVVQPDGKLVAAGDTVSFATGNVESDIVLARYNRFGSLDTSFGNGGRVVTDFGRQEKARALVVQSDGKLVAAIDAPSSNFDSFQVILVRYNPDGSLDMSFGVGGVVVVDNVCCPHALVRQPDGKLVVNASSLIRLNPDGTLDTSFGGDGVVSDRLSTGGLALQPDGKLVTAGKKPDFSVCCDGDFALERFNPDGSPDTSFGSGGLVVTALGEPSDANALVLQADGKLVAAGALGAVDQNPDQRVLARYHSDGSLDTSFGIGGLVVTDGGNSIFGWFDLAVQTDGRLVAGTGFLPILARHNPDGSPDTSFGTGGEVALPLLDLPFGSGLAFQTDGKLVAAGEAFLSGDSDFGLVRVLTTNERPKPLPKCGGRPATILGTSGNDTLRGTRGPDVILGRGGNDTIRGLQGNDTICGGRGRDRLIGNEGNDLLFGEDGDDKLFGDKGRDRLDGGSGRDACRTGERARLCEGKPASSKPPPGERPKDPPKPPCPPVGNFPCS